MTATKRKTWRDRPRSSLAFKIDIVDSGGGRCVLEGRPFESKATPSQATTAIVRLLAIYFGERRIAVACLKGVRQAEAAVAKARVQKSKARRRSR